MEIKSAFIILTGLAFLVFKNHAQTVNKSDYDGNIYNEVTIGNQVWMQENLKTTHYSNGDAISHVTGDAQWDWLIYRADCNYNNDTNNAIIYGRLYNWYAIADSRNL